MQFNRERRCPGQAVNKALQEWQEFDQVAQKARDEALEVDKEQMNDKWQAPWGGMIKLNTDAAMDMRNSRVSWSIVARNQKGEIVKVWAGSEQRKGDPLVEEADAVRRALIKAKAEGWENIEVQSDCKAAIERIKEENAQDARIGTIVEDISRMRLEFSNCFLSFIKREGNSVSHEMARFALTCISEIQWKDSFPSWLTRLARKDLGAVAPSM